MPKGRSFSEKAAVSEVLTLRPMLMQYRIEYDLNRHRKSPNNKLVKHKAIILPLGTSVIAQFLDSCCVVDSEQKTEYMELYFYFRKKCLEGTGHPDVSLPVFEQRLTERVYQVTHQLAHRAKLEQPMNDDMKAKTARYLSTKVVKEGKLWLGLGIRKNAGFELHLPEGFLEFDAEDDESAYEYLTGLPEFMLDDERPIAGKNYLRFSRPKFWLRK